MTTGERARLHRLAIAILMMPADENVNSNMRVRKQLVMIEQMALLGMLSDDFMSRYFGFIACIRQHDEQRLAMLEIVNGMARIHCLPNDRKPPEIKIVDRRRSWQMKKLNRAIEKFQIVEVQDAA